MGGPGSRSYSSAGRKKTRAVSVVGTGKPTMPKGLPGDVQKAFKALAKLTEGFSFSQDSRTILEAAELIVRQDSFLTALRLTPLDEKLNRTSLAVGRQLNLLLGKLGLNPRDRQVLLAPVDTESEVRFSLSKAARDRDRGVPNRKRDTSKERFFR